MINNLTIAVTTVAFSKNTELVANLNSLGFKRIKTNTDGKRFAKDELLMFLSDADCAIVGLDKIDESVLKHLPKLKAISKYGVGLDNINTEDCEKNDVAVLHTQGVNKRSVAEMTLGFMLSLARNLYQTSNLLKTGVWKKDGGTQLSGKRVGIIGAGNIGKEVISLLEPFACEILVNDIINQNEYYKKNNLQEVTKKEIFTKADIITIHTPLTTDTKYLINKHTLSLMKPSAFVINTARGGIINHDDLKDALQNKIIAGAAIDVYQVEPPEDKELILLPNLINTPHIGGNAKEAVEAMGMAAINNLLTWAAGK